MYEYVLSLINTSRHTQLNYRAQYMYMYTRVWCAGTKESSISELAREGDGGKAYKLSSSALVKARTERI